MKYRTHRALSAAVLHCPRLLLIAIIQPESACSETKKIFRQLKLFHIAVLKDI